MDNNRIMHHLTTTHNTAALTILPTSFGSSLLYKDMPHLFGLRLFFRGCFGKMFSCTQPRTVDVVVLVCARWWYNHAFFEH
jgi:hypothetical protein